MKRRAVTSKQIRAALDFYEASRPEPARASCLWRVHWLRIEPTVCRYQNPVPLARVLSEHVGAITAEPIGD